MEKLELKHLAPYRDKELKFIMTCDFLDEFGHYEDWSGKEEDYIKGSIWTWAGYIDRDLIISCDVGDLTWVFRKNNTWISFDIKNKGIKPILRPLSDLTKDEFKEKLNAIFIERYGNVQFTEYNLGYKDREDFTLTATYALLGDVFTDSVVSRGKLDNVRYWIIEFLLENHYDIFGLIKKGLAIDINKQLN